MRSMLIAACILIGFATSASAQSRHQTVEVKALKDGGETVGIRLKLTLRPDHKGDGGTVRIGIGRANWATFGAAAGVNDHRQAASDIDYGYAVYLQEIQGIDTDEPRVVELEIPYTALPGVTPGDDIDVFTTWNQGNNHPFWHVWGINQLDKKLIRTTPRGKVRPYSKQPKALMTVMSASGPVPVALTLSPVSSKVMAPTPPGVTATSNTRVAKAKLSSPNRAAAKPTPRIKRASR